MNKGGNWLWDWMPFFYDQFYQRFPPYQELHQEIIRNLPGSPSTTERILDAGCGTGLLGFKLAKRGYSVLGIDQSPRMLKFAENKKRGKKLDNLLFLERDLNKKINLDEYSVGKILFVHSLYLLKNPGKTLKDLCSTLPVGGEVILCNPWRRLSVRELWRGGIFFLRPIRQEAGFFSFFGFLLIASIMGILNTIIQRKKDKKAYHCWDKKEIENLLKTSGLKIKWLKESCLYNSHLLVWAIKE